MKKDAYRTHQLVPQSEEAMREVKVVTTFGNSSFKLGKEMEQLVQAAAKAQPLKEKESYIDKRRRHIRNAAETKAFPSVRAQSQGTRTDYFVPAADLEKFVTQAFTLAIN